MSGQQRDGMSVDTFSLIPFQVNFSGPGKSLPSVQYGKTTESPPFVRTIRECFYRAAPFHVVREIQVRRYGRSRCFWRPVHKLLNVKDLSTSTDNTEGSLYLLSLSPV